MLVKAILINLIFGQISLSTGIEETKLPELNYEPNVYNDHIGLSNVIVKKHKLTLRSNIGESSMVRWDKPNPIENWSFSFNISEPNLASNEFAGIYLYYTKEKTLTGAFNGGNEHFDGFVFGLEMKGKAADIVFGRNDGSNFLEKAEFAIRRDSINPKRFLNLTEITFKVIATSQNIKIEIFSNGKIIYDGFKIPNSLGANISGNYFGIISDYKNTPSGKAFVLSHAQLYSRKELGPYKIYESLMDKVESHLRDKKEIKHNDVDVRELIHKAELTEHLIKYSLGELPKTKITMAREEIEKDIKIISEKIDQIAKLKKPKVAKHDLSTRMNEFEIKLNQVLRSVNTLEYIVGSVSKKQMHNQSNLQYVAFVVGIIGTTIFVYREVATYLHKDLNK